MKDFNHSGAGSDTCNAAVKLIVDAEKKSEQLPDFMAGGWQ